MQRWECPIYNGTLNSVSDQIWIKTLCLFWFMVSLGKLLANFLLKRKTREIHINIKCYLTRFLFEICLKGCPCKSGIFFFAWRVSWNYTLKPISECPKGKYWNWKLKIERVLLWIRIVTLEMKDILKLRLRLLI